MHHQPNTYRADVQMGIPQHSCCPCQIGARLIGVILDEAKMHQLTQIHFKYTLHSPKIPPVSHSNQLPITLR